MQEMWVRSLGQENPLEKSMATPGSVLVWRISWTKEPGGLQCMGSEGLRHDWSSGSHTHTLTHTNAITSWLPPWGSGTQYNSGPFERHVGHTQWCPPGGVRLLFIHQLPSSLLGDHQTWGHHLQNSQGCRKKPSSREMLVLEVRRYQHVWEQFSDQKSTSKVQPWRHGKGRHCLPAERNWHYPHFPDGDLKAQRG